MQQTGQSDTPLGDVLKVCTVDDRLAYPRTTRIRSKDAERGPNDGA